jgi:hypothetical protein
MCSCIRDAARLGLDIKEGECQNTAAGTTSEYNPLVTASPRFVACRSPRRRKYKMGRAG